MHLGRRCRWHHQPGYRPIRWLRSLCSYNAHALSGKTVRVYFGSFLYMKTGTLRARFAVLPLALAGIFPGAFAQTIEKQNNLQEIVVTASRYAQPLSDVMSDLTVLDRESIQLQGASNISQLLATQAGVQVSGNSIYLRGAESRMTSLYIDGVRVESHDGQNFGGGVLWDLVPVDQIDRIEILRGAASAVYGSDAMAGVIQIFTKRGKTGLHPYASAGSGSNNTRKTNVGVRGGFGAIDYALGFAWQESDGINTRPDLVHTPDTEGYKKNLMHAQLGFDLNKEQRLEARFLEHRVDARTVPWGGGNDTTGTGVISTSSVGLQSQWSESTKTNLKLTRSVSAKKDSAPNDYATTLEGASLDAEFKGLAGVITGQLDQRWDAYDAKPTTWDPAVTGNRTTSAIGIGYGTKFEKHALQVNARNDQDSIFGVYQTGAFSYAYTMSENWKVSASVGNAFRAPTLEQVFGPYGSVQLQPEKSQNSEISIDYALNKASFKTTLFRNSFDNMISSSQTLTTCAAAGYCYYNIDKASVEGATLRATYDWQHLHFYGVAEWLNPKNDLTGETLLNRARRVMTLGMEAATGDWTYGADLKETGERFDNSTLTRLTLPSYTLLNVYFSKKLSKDWQWKTRFDNVTDVKYQHIYQVATPGATLFTSIHWTP